MLNDKQNIMEKYEPMSATAKYGMVGTMILVTIGVFLYLLKKTFEARNLNLKEEEEKAREGYAKLTILEEQEDIMEDNMADEYNINTDFQDESFHYNFITEDLWEDFLINLRLKQREKCSKKGAELSASMYYQAFAKYLKIHLIELQNLKSLELRRESSVKLKVMITNGEKGSQMTETSKPFPIEDNIDMNEKITFKIKEKELKYSILYISLFCDDVFYQEYLLGAVSFDLSIANYRVRQSINEEILPVKKVNLDTLIFFLFIKTIS